MPRIALPSARTAINRAEARPFSRNPILPPAVTCVTPTIKRVLNTSLLQRMDTATRPLANNFALGRTTPSIIENKSLTATRKTPIGTATTQTRKTTFPLRGTTLQIIENKPLTAAPKTPIGFTTTQTQMATLSLGRTTLYIIENTPLAATLKTLTPATCVTTPTPHPRTLNRPLFHNCAISLNIRHSNINAAISKSNHINASGCSRLILWSWPPSCNLPIANLPIANLYDASSITNAQNQSYPRRERSCRLRSS